MSRLLFVLILIFALRGHTQESRSDRCTVDNIDKQGCVTFGQWRVLSDLGCKPLPICFSIPIKEEPRKFFLNEDKEERKKIIPVLDSSAVALLKNSNLKDIKIIFYSKGKLSKNFAIEAEKYLLEKGVKKSQFKIEVRE